MAIMDAKLVFSDCQTICFTAAAQTQTISTNIVDLGAEDLDIGAGTPLYLNIRIGPTIDVPGRPVTGDLTFKLKTATGSAFNNTGTLIERRLLASQITAGKWIMRLPIPQETNRYLRLMYVKGATGTGYTSLTVSGWLSPAVPETNVGT